MNIQKLKKKKEKVLSDGNLNNLFYVCKELADVYFRQELYGEALQEYKEMEKISDANNNKMDKARCNRMIGEVYSEMGDFDKALKHQKKHLKISCEEEDMVEQQRALATIGRTYFLQAESYVDPFSLSKDNALSNAKTNFLQSLSVCEKIDEGCIGIKQKMEMRSRLFLNLGLVMESQNQLDQAVEHLTKAIMISKKLELWEELVRTYSALGSIYQKKHESRLALSTYDQAITVAERLPDKVLHVGPILVLKAEVLLELPDFLGAKQTLLRAYKLNISNQKRDKLEVEKKLRIVAAMCEIELNLTNLAPAGDCNLRKKMYEDLGDMASELGSFTTALTYYHLMLECVEKSGNDKKALIESYVSLAQTYKDNGQYLKAIEYFQKELELEEHDPAEACKTNMNIAELHGLLGTTDEMMLFYEKARNCSHSSNNVKLKKTVLNCAYKAHTEAKSFSTAEAIQRELMSYNQLDMSESESEEEEEKREFGAHICLDDLSDMEGDDGIVDERRKITRSRAKPKNNLQRRNEKGETPLHVAAIAGNEVLVAKLIDQGHSIDVKDFSGWTPLHEACNHGHRGVAEVLLSKGAAVNDRGGPHCDGVTPLLDAASNGSLDCIELLLDHGASPLMRTNSGESLLDCLAAWRQRRLNEVGTDLDDVTLSHYLSIYKKIQLILEKAGQKVSNNDTFYTKDVPLADGRQSRRAIAENNKHSASLYRRKSKEKDKTTSQRFHAFDDAADEYENAMKALRYRHHQTESPMVKPSRIPALIVSEEYAGDKWLEEDQEQIHPNKKRRVCQFGGGEPQRRPSDISRPENVSGHKASAHLTRSTPSPLSDNSSLVDSTDSEDINEMLNAFKSSSEATEVVSTPDDSLDAPSTSGLFSNKLKEMNSVRRKQISLMATGVTKEKVVKTSQLSEKTLQTSTSPSPLFTCVKVRVEDKLLLVPLPHSPTQPLTISWLANELAIRYRSLEGIEPVLRIETQDGALFVDSDPLTILLGMGELNGRVQTWKLPSLCTIYQEACQNTNLVSDSQVITALETCQATNSVSFEDLFLDHTQMGPILKALSYHLPLQTLVFSGNNISDRNIKEIGSCIAKLSQLKSLDLSNINITSFGLGVFVKTIVENRALQRLEFLNISYNPLGDCLLPLGELLNAVPSLRTLSMASVNLTQESFRNCPYYSLDCIESLDINFNKIGSEGVIDLLGRLNCHALVELKMAATADNTVREVAFFLQHFSPQMLVLLDLSYCATSDYEISELIKGVQKCRKLAKLSLDGVVGATNGSVEPLLGLASIRELSLCGIEANQPVQVTNHLSSLTISSCVDQAWATQRGPFGFYQGGSSVRQSTTTH